VSLKKSQVNGSQDELKDMTQMCHSITISVTLALLVLVVVSIGTMSLASQMKEIYNVFGEVTNMSITN
jgi:hypothetical protein